MHIYRIQKQISRLSSKFKSSLLAIPNKVKKFLKQKLFILSSNCMTKLSKSSILRFNLCETQTQMEIIVDNWRREVTKSWYEINIM